MERKETHYRKAIRETLLKKSLIIWIMQLGGTLLKKPLNILSEKKPIIELTDETI